MRRAVQWLRQILPESLVLMLFLGLMLVVVRVLTQQAQMRLDDALAAEQRYSTQTGFPIDESAILPHARVVIGLHGPFLLAAAVFGFWRVTAFHPALQESYRNWLRMTPWQPGQPLPLGTPTLDVRDLALLAAGSVIASPHFLMALAAGGLGLIAGLLAGASLTAIRLRQWAWAYALGAVFCALPSAAFRGWLAGGLAAAAAWGLAHLSLRQSLRAFPWPQLTNSISASERERQVLGWPWQLKAQDRDHFELPRAHAIPLGLSAAWLLLATGDLIVASSRWTVQPSTEDEPYMGLATALGGTGVFILATAAIYLPLATPATGLFGRIGARRLIIPGYDRLIVAPAAAALLSLVLYWLLDSLKIGQTPTSAACAGLLVALFVGTSPAVQTWRLTAPGKLSPNLVKSKDLEEL